MHLTKIRLHLTKLDINLTHLTFMTKSSTELFIVFLGLTLLITSLFFPEFVFAGTGGEELSDVVTKTEGMISGNGGKLVALASFIGGVIWSAASGSLKNLIVPTVLGVVLGIGPSMVTGGISAII